MINQSITFNCHRALN